MKYALNILIFTLAISAAAPAQSGASLEAGSISTPRTINPAANSTNPSASAGQRQNPFLGSVPSGTATTETIDLSLQDAVERGLRSNLGAIENQASLRQSDAQRMRALANMLPNVSALVRQNLDRLSRAALGLKIPGLPSSTGEFAYQEGYIAVSDNGLNIDSLLRLRSARRAVEATRFGLDDAREVIVLAVGTAYLQVEASEARLHTYEAQLEVAHTLEDQTADRVRSGLSPEIDQFRATVQRQTSEQRVTVAQANVEKDKLTLARLIGLPSGQIFRITPIAPYASWNGPALEDSLRQARENRSDIRSARAAAEAATLGRKAAQAERLPGLSVNGYYGRLGTTLTQSDHTYTVAATVSLPIFTGGRIRADVQDASAQLDSRQAEYLDLLGRVDYEVRNAFIDLRAAESAVQVAQKNSELSQKALEQAGDRFTNGVTNNLEVVQAQQESAAARENYIASLFAHNLAKLALLRALGTAQKDIARYLGGN